MRETTEEEYKSLRLRSVEIALNFAERTGTPLDLVEEADKIFQYINTGNKA